MQTAEHSCLTATYQLDIQRLSTLRSREYLIKCIKITLLAANEIISFAVQVVWSYFFTKSIHYTLHSPWHHRWCSRFPHKRTANGIFSRFDEAKANISEFFAGGTMLVSVVGVDEQRSLLSAPFLEQMSNANPFCMIMSNKIERKWYEEIQISENYVSNDRFVQTHSHFQFNKN